MDIILDRSRLENQNERRRKLLPIWIKVFIWIFLVFGAFVPIVAVIGAIGEGASLSVYGFKANQTLSVIGMFITAVFTIKGLAAYGLWTERAWAVKLAIFDACLGIAVCVLQMTIFPFVLEYSEFSLRLELVALIPYLAVMRKISLAWSESEKASS